MHQIGLKQVGIGAQYGIFRIVESEVGAKQSVTTKVIQIKVLEEAGRRRPASIVVGHLLVSYGIVVNVLARVCLYSGERGCGRAGRRGANGDGRHLSAAVVVAIRSTAHAILSVGVACTRIAHVQTAVRYGSTSLIYTIVIAIIIRRHIVVVVVIRC